MKKYYFIICIASLLFISCQSTQKEINEQNKINEQEENITIKEEENAPYDQWLSLLLSPYYFEYTQGARKFLALPPDDAVYYLYKHKNALRETNDTMQPVCLLLIKLIFQQQNDEWITEKTKCSIPTLVQIAQQELKCRHKNQNFTKQN